MSRTIWLVPFLVAACASCGKSAGSQDKDVGPTTAPTTKVDLDGSGATAKGPATPNAPTSDDARFHLHADEGTLAVATAEGKAGSELTSNVMVTPAGAYHVNTEYPSKLTLEPPAGVKLAKAELTAGGMDKAQGDAIAFSEKGLEFAVKATADKPGSYEIKGTFKFAVCTNNNTQCLPKKQPITVTVAAN